MNQDFNFFRTKMPNTRQADYYLGCLDSCVFIDFNLTKDNCIYLRRISFDGYGCCDLHDVAANMGVEDSKLFIEAYQMDDLDQEVMTLLIKKSIDTNKEHIWEDALREYSLLGDE